MPTTVGPKQQEQELVLAKKLESLKSADKKTTWIRGDLSTSKSSVIGRLFWTIAKHFDWMRRLFYSVDLENSKASLMKLKPRVQENPTLQALFDAAVANFNKIAPNHKVIFDPTVPKVSSDEAPTPAPTIATPQETPTTNEPMVAATEAEVGEVDGQFIRRFGNTDVVVKTGNLTRENVDAIVNAANSSLLGGGGVDGAIHSAGGPQILAECRQIRQQDEYRDGLPTGEAVITGSGNMAQYGIQHVVHTVGPRGSTPDRQRWLRNAYYNSLVVAEQNGAKTVAFPSISTGIFAYPLEEATEVAIGAIKEFAESHSGIDEIRLIMLPSAINNFNAYKAALENA